MVQTLPLASVMPRVEPAVITVSSGLCLGAGGSGLVEVPPLGDQAADGLVLPHQSLALFSCQTVPLT